MGNIYLLRAFINCSYRLVSANHYHNFEERSDFRPRVTITHSWQKSPSHRSATESWRQSACVHGKCVINQFQISQVMDSCACNSSYPKECGQKCSSKLRVEPFWWIIYIVVIITFTDYISIIVEDHTQPSDKEDSEERGLYTATVKEIKNYRNEVLLLNSIHPTIIIGCWG